MRLKTGVELFDRVTLGGFTSNSLNLLMGPPGCGKSVICLQYVMESVSKGVSAAYLSLDQSLESFLSSAKSLNYPIGESIESGMLHFESISCDELSHRLSMGLHELESRVRAQSIERIVIDPISPFLFMWDCQQLMLAQTTRLCDSLRNMGVCSLLTCQKDIGLSYGIDYIADSVTKLTCDRKLSVIKMRGSPHKTEPQPYKIDESGVSGI